MRVSADPNIREYLPQHMRLIYDVGATTGLRISDILSLRKRILYIKQPTIRERKTGKRKRIYIRAALRKDLLRYARNKSKADYIFSHAKTGKPYTRQAVYAAFQKAEQKAGHEKNVGTHSARKAYAQNLKAKGYSLEQIQKKMNHSHLGDTLRYLI